jgi:hypothetical protein
MDTAYNRRIASINDAIMERAARHAPANFVGRGYGSDSGIDTQYNDVMRGAANHPRALSQAEREYRMEGCASAFGGSFLDDLGQAFRYTPIGMASDAISGRDTVLSGRGQLTITHGGAGYGGAGYGGNAATMVGVTMPYREVPYAGVIDKARSGSGKPKFPLETKVQVGNSDGSGKVPPPQVEAAWFENFDDFKSGRNRMKDSKKVGRMTKDPELVASGGRDFTKEELEFVQDLLGKSGAGFYGGAWYNDWGDFTEAISEAYDTVKGVWEDYVKPVLDVVGTPLKEALISSGNPYGEAGAGVLELLGYGEGGGDGVGGMYGAPSGMSGGMYGAPSGRSGGRARLVKGSPEAKAYMASIRAKRGSKGGNMSMGMGMKGCGEGVFADAKPIAANSLGFSPKLEVEQLNAATGSTSYGDMPSSNPVGSGIGGRKRKIVPKNSRGVSSAPTKMGEGYEDEDGFYVTTPRDLERHKRERYTSLDGNADADSIKNRMKQAAKDILEAARRNAPEIAEYGRDKLLQYIGAQLPAEFRGYEPVAYLATQPFIDEWKEKIKKEVNRDKPRIGQGGSKISRKTAKKEREGLLVSGDNSMGAIVAERGYSQKAQKKAGAVDEVASQNIWDGTQMENTTGRSAKKINNLILNGVTKGVSQGGSMSGGEHALIQQNNLHGVVTGGAMSKMKSEYSGKGGGKTASAYNAFVSKMMKDKGMKLAEAVKYIKANGLYKK